MDATKPMFDCPKCILTGGAVLGIIFGIAAGSSIAAEPQSRGLTINDLVPASFDSATVSREDMRQQMGQNHSPLETEHGVIAVTDLAEYGRTGKVPQRAVSYDGNSGQFAMADAPMAAIEQHSAAPVAAPAPAVAPVARSAEFAVTSQVDLATGQTTGVAQDSHRAGNAKVIDVAAALAEMQGNS